MSNPPSHSLLAGRRNQINDKSLSLNSYNYSGMTHSCNSYELATVVDWSKSSHLHVLIAQNYSFYSYWEVMCEGINKWEKMLTGADETCPELLFPPCLPLPSIFSPRALGCKQNNIQQDEISSERKCKNNHHFRPTLISFFQTCFCHNETSKAKC